MSDYFRIKISKNSDLHKKLGIPGGNYRAIFDIARGALELDPIDRRGEESIIQLSLKQLAALSMSPGVEFKSIDADLYERIKERKDFRDKDAPSSKVAHHIIPHDLCNSHILVLKAKGFNSQGEENKMYLPGQIHQGQHEKYTRAVKKYLDLIWNDMIDAGVEDDQEAIDFEIQNLLKILRKELELMKQSMASVNGLDIRGYY